MWKEIVGHKNDTEKKHHIGAWLAVEQMARAQLTSEDPEYPLENALSTNPECAGKGWMAGESGPQTITLNFQKPVRIRRIFLRFTEADVERTQEFSLRYSAEAGVHNEIVRQQWNFSPNGATEEIEDYTVALEGVTRLELAIDPDLGRGRLRATLSEWRIA